MAKKHKAATQVTIAATEESPLQDLVQRLWKPAALVAVLIVCGVLGSQYLRQQSEAAEAASWDRFREDVTLNAGLFGGIQTPSASVLSSLAGEIEGTPAAPWAHALEAHKLVEDGEYEAAAAALRELEEKYPDHVLVTEPMQFGEDEAPQRLSDHLLSRMDAVGRWEKNHESLFKNPAPPLDCPKVRLNTSKGSILVGLYQAEAPKHVENFLKLCGEGYYDATLFHRIGKDFMIQGGDPNSRDGEPETWGQGGPDYKVEPELTELRHFRYVLAAAKTPIDTESSGSQFYITTGTPHHLDGQHTIFGAVLDGTAVVDEIASGEIAEGQTDRPRDPVSLNSTDVVE
ncbi:MAG: peptidylprolyl isomerase [Planctomycetota bacterium]